VDVHDKLDELAAVIENARSMPMSASCVVNRGEVLGLLEELRELLPEEFRHAEMLLQDREAVVDEGSREATRLIAEARAEQARLVSQSEVLLEAHRAAAEVREAPEVRPGPGSVPSGPRSSAVVPAGPLALVLVGPGRSRRRAAWSGAADGFSVSGFRAIR